MRKTSKICAIIAAVSGMAVILRLCLPWILFKLGTVPAHYRTASEAGAIGIIGGADGPTAIYTTALPFFMRNGLLIIFGIICLVFAVIALIFNRGE